MGFFGLINDENINFLVDVFPGLVPGFTKTHAKIFLALSCGERKTAKQLINETGVDDTKLYMKLDLLLAEKLIKKTGELPASYYLAPIDISVKNLVNARKTELDYQYTQIKSLCEVARQKVEGYQVYLGKSSLKIVSLKNNKPFIVSEHADKEVKKVKEKLREWKKSLC